MRIHEHGNMEHDDFADGLELGMWSERRDMYVPVSEYRKELLIPKLGSFIEVFTEQDLINEIGGQDDQSASV